MMYAVQLGDWETLSIFLKSHLVSFTIKVIQLAWHTFTVASYVSYAHLL